MRTLMFAFFIFTVLPFAYSQTISGKVIDQSTNEPLSFVRIGVAGKNVGTISRDNGEFAIDTTKIQPNEKIIFSMVGYVSYSATLSQIASGATISLTPAIYSLKEVTVSAKEIVEIVKLGRAKATRTTIGHSGNSEWGTGGEWGLRILTKGDTVALQEIAFHTKFNTVDSVLFRINIYAIEGDLPGKNLLNSDVFVTSHAKDKWVIKDVTNNALKLNSDFAITIEIIHIWYRKGGENQLFFTYGDNSENLPTFSRPSSHARWSLNEMPPLALYVTARKLNEK